MECQGPKPWESENIEYQSESTDFVYEMTNKKWALI